MLAGATVACATPAPFRADRPVELSGRDATGRTRFVQDGKAIDPDELMAYLEAREATRADARAFQTWRDRSVALGLPGFPLALVGLGVLEASDSRALGWTLLGTGGVLALGSVYAAVRSERYAASAVGTHNATVAQRAGTLSPVLGAVRDHAGRERVALGLHGRF